MKSQTTVAIFLGLAGGTGAFVQPRLQPASARPSATHPLHSEEPGKIVESIDEPYDFNEADFADYNSDYSDLEGGELDLDLDEDDLDEFLLESGYDDYSDIAGPDLGPFERHAREVFMAYAERTTSSLDVDTDDESQMSQLTNYGILKKDLYVMLQQLDIDASEEEAEVLFNYLDIDGDGHVTLEEFLPWYAEAIDSVQQVSVGFQNLVKSRRTVHRFDATEVDDGVLRRALECAIAAPNRSGSEPWRFIKLGKETVGKITELRDKLGGKKDGSFVSWTKAPHWIVVTYTRAELDSGIEGQMKQREDFKSVCCAVQNFLLSMWSEGIGTKWTTGPVQRTPEFAEICGVDLEKEKVAGVIWYGFAKGGLKGAQPKLRRKGVEEVLDVLP